MTSDEIKAFNVNDTNSDITMLREIAYQLAVMNERATKLELLQSSPWPGAIAREFPANLDQALGSIVPAGSESAVRGGIEGFEPPPVGVFAHHIFVRIFNNRFCGHCGAGEHHAIHTVSAALPAE